MKACVSPTKIKMWRAAVHTLSSLVVQLICSVKSVCVHVNVCIDICVCVSVYVCVYVCVCVCVCVLACVHACVLVD